MNTQGTKEEKHKKFNKHEKNKLSKETLPRQTYAV